jgi:hypothetical protein
MPDPYENLRSDLRKIIGLDFVYISIADSARRFDPITVVTAYASILFLVYVKEALATLGKKTGEAIWDRVSKSILQDETLNGSVEENQQKDIRNADEILKRLGAEISRTYINDFYDAGKLAVEQRLISDRFPVPNAKRISGEIAKLVRERTKI